MKSSGNKFNSLDDLRQLLGEKPEGNRPKVPRGGHDGKGMTVDIRLDTKGRKGKAVTLISGFRHNPQVIDEIARMLKQHCGAGGTVKDGTIEIQGDQRERVAAKLRDMNYRVS